MRSLLASCREVADSFVPSVLDGMRQMFPTLPCDRPPEAGWGHADCIGQRFERVPRVVAFNASRLHHKFIRQDGCPM